MRKPDFFIVGAPRSGTTAMNAYLAQHPDLFVSDTKELAFFGSDIDLKHTFVRSQDRFAVTESTYLKHFEGCTTEKRIGEATVWYLYSEQAAAEIKDYCPDASIIIMLRHPVDMMYSLYHWYSYDLFENIDTFEAALDAEEERKHGAAIPDESFWRKALYYREMATYSTQVSRYIDTFGADNVHVILFDDFKSDSAETYRKLLEFLGVDTDFKANFEIMNTNQRFRNRWLHELSINPPRIVQVLIAPLLANTTLRSIIKYIVKSVNTEKTNYPPIDSALRKKLTAEFTPEIVKLAKIIDRDLSGWMST